MNKLLLSSVIALLASQTALADLNGSVLDPLSADLRQQTAYDFREQAANQHLLETPVIHTNNGDEKRVPHFYAQFSKSLPHDNKGKVDSSAYNQLLAAIKAGSFEAFEAVPAGGPVKLANPLAAQVYDLEGRDSHAYSIKPAPKLASAEAAAEMVELFGHALLRDVPFSAYNSHPQVAALAKTLAGLDDFNGPVTTDSLFRGGFEGDFSGPYISQFLYQDIPAGPKVYNQKYTGYSAQNFMTNFNEWLAIENGNNPTAEVTKTTEHYMLNGRDLARYVHKDFSYQAFQNAALILLSWGSSVIDDGNPYKTAQRQGAFIDLGAPEVLDMVARAANGGLRAAWYQKWNVHRRLRPEEYAGVAVNEPDLVHSQFFAADVVQAAIAENGTALLPMAYPEGAPTHPAYPAGHASIAGASVTVLKAFFKEEANLPKAYEPNADGSQLVSLGNTVSLTVGGELNKLATNISLGRDWAGVHYRSDGIQGLLLGEQVGIAVLRDWRKAHPKQPAFTLKKFNGEEIQI